MVVPAGAAHSGAVSAGAGQALVGVRHPAHGDLDLRQRPQRGGVGRRRNRSGRSDVEHRHVPGAAHHGDVGVAGLDRSPDRATHVGLAAQLGPGRHGSGAHGCHRLGDGLEGDQAVAAVFDHVLPPALSVGFAGCCRKCAERIDRGVAVEQPVLAAGPRGQRVGEREVDRLDRDLVAVGPADRLPFRAEHRQRGEHGTSRVVDHVPEQRHGRFEPGVLAHPSEQRPGLGRRLDQHDRRAHLVERRQHRTRRARPVVPDPEQMQPHRCTPGDARRVIVCGVVCGSGYGVQCGGEHRSAHPERAATRQRSDGNLLPLPRVQAQLICVVSVSATPAGESTVAAHSNSRQAS